MQLQKNYSCQVVPVICSDGILSFSEWQGTGKWYHAQDEDPTNICSMEEFNFSLAKWLCNFWMCIKTVLIDDALLFKVSFSSN